MRVAVLSLTRDRLAYTRHCFTRLAEMAGCEYDHIILDQGSTDGTVDWLTREYDYAELTMSNGNMGINRGMNHLLDDIDLDEYDVIVKFDNDCELLTPNTLRDICEIVAEVDVILSPRIHGLRNPVPTLHRDGFDGAIDYTAIVGGIFMAVPAHVFQNGYRHNPHAGLWGSDDSDLCRYFQQNNGKVGYLRGYDANHYLTTDGQHADIPAYFERTLAEGKPSIL